MRPIDRKPIDLITEGVEVYRVCGEAGARKVFEFASADERLALCGLFLRAESELKRLPLSEGYLVRVARMAQLVPPRVTVRGCFYSWCNLQTGASGIALADHSLTRAETQRRRECGAVYPLVSKAELCGLVEKWNAYGGNVWRYEIIY